MAYSGDILVLGADHHWSFDGDSLDQIGSANGTDTTVIYTNAAIAEDAVNCVTTDAVGDRVSIPTTTDIDSSTQSRWGFGGWFATTTTQEPPKSIAGRGDGTDSMRFILFLGNNLMVEADPGSTDTILQVFADTFLANNRSYHLFARWSGSGFDNLFDFFLDGVKMTNAEPANRQPGIASFPATTVLEFADPAGIVSVGGTAVVLNAPVNGKYNHWTTFNDGDIPTDTEVRETLFERGALADVTISSGTELAMQTAIDVYASTVRGDAPLCIEVEAVTGGGDFTLDLDDITFSALASCHIRYNGTAGTLTVRNTNGADCSIVAAPFGGAIKLITEVTAKVTVKDVTSGAVIQNARVLMQTESEGAAFSDTFTGTNDDAWDSGKWTTSKEGSVGSAVDVQSNQGRMYAGTTIDDFGSATAASVTEVNDGEVLLWVDPNATDIQNKWLYICLRSTGEQVAANAGRPATAYYVRIEVNADSDEGDDNLYRRLSNSEISLCNGLDSMADAAGNVGRNFDEPFWIKFKAIDSGSDTVLSVRMWDADATEPTGWGTYTDTTPGALNGASGALQLVARNFTGSYSVDVRVDGVSFDSLSGGGATTTIIDKVLTDSLGVASSTWDYETDVNIEGRVRKTSASPYYKTGTIAGTITEDGLDLTVLLVGDE